ncbi:MAG TPA: YfhO family protein [Candidatus Polarisedimenticolia bacterium]
MRGAAALAVVAAVLLALIVALHGPVFTRGALVTPAGMHYAQWPWKAGAAEAVRRGATLEENPTLSDLLFQVYPWQRFIVRSLQSGAVPLWNPYSYCGVPFVANAQSAIFYPLHWPAWILPSMRAFTFAILAKILLAGLFMAVFLRGLGCSTLPCIVGAVSFGLCGFMTSWLGYAHTNAAVALPLLMHAARRLALAPSTGAFLLLVSATGAQYLGGHPETSLHIVGAAAACFLWHLPSSSRPRAATALFAGGSTLGFLLAAIQLLPFLQYLMESAALEQRRNLPGLDPSLPASALATFLVPDRFGRPWDFSYRGPAEWQAMAGYAGAGVLLLALLSLRWWKEVRFLALLALACGAIVYGPPQIRSLIRAIPLAGISSNNRLLLLISFCLAAMAAVSLEAISARAAAWPRGDRMRALGLIALISTALMAVALVAGAVDPQSPRLACGILGGTALLAALAVLRPARGDLYLAGVAAITCVDLFLFAYRFNPHANPADLFPSTSLTDALRRDVAADPARGGRLMTVGWTMRPETQMVYGLSSIEGYDAMELARYRRLLDRAQVASIHETGLIPAGSRPLLDLMGTRYIVTPPGGVVSGPEMSLMYDGPDGRVFVNAGARPRLTFVTRAEALSGNETLEALAGSRSDPWNRVLIEDDATLGRPDRVDEADGPRPTITLDLNLPGSLTATVRGQTGPGYLVVADAWHGGWRAEVNGRPATVLRADYCFMAVSVPAGEARVVLEYRPGAFTAGVWVSALALLGTLIAGLSRLGRQEAR